MTMLRFQPVKWEEGLRPWLYSDPDLSADASGVEARLSRGKAAAMVARNEAGEVVGMLAASEADGYLLIEAVAGGAMVMRAAILWAKEMVRLMGLKGARAYTVKPGVVYHMARAGARLDGAYLSWGV